MALKCQAPDCDHEFSDAVFHGVTEARSAGETPYFTHVFESPDGFGVTTSHICSADCMAEYLDEMEAADA